jgi:hypothetical protein
MYLDSRNAIYMGPCVPLGIDSQELMDCATGSHTQFNGFRIPANARYFRRVDDELVKSHFVPPGRKPLVTGKHPLSPRGRTVDPFGEK